MINEIMAKAIQKSEKERFFPEYSAAWADYEPEAQATIDALEKAGFVIVPVEPTEEMLMAVPLLVCGIDPSYSNHAVSRKVFKAMIKTSVSGTLKTGEKE